MRGVFGKDERDSSKGHSKTLAVLARGLLALRDEGMIQVHLMYRNAHPPTSTGYLAARAQVLHRNEYLLPVCFLVFQILTLPDAQ